MLPLVLLACSEERQECDVPALQGDSWQLLLARLQALMPQSWRVLEEGLALLIWDEYIEGLVPLDEDSMTDLGGLGYVVIRIELQRLEPSSLTHMLILKHQMPIFNEILENYVRSACTGTFDGCRLRFQNPDDGLWLDDAFAALRRQVPGHVLRVRPVPVRKVRDLHTQEVVFWKDLGLLGRGGFAEVRKVWDPVAEHLYAMKLSLDSSKHESIRREAQLLLTELADVPNLLQVVRAVEEWQLEAWVPAYVMPVAEGPLPSLVQESGLDMKQMWAIFQPVRDCLLYMHREKKVVHMDVKPENILVTQLLPLMVKLADPGCSGRLGSPALGFTPEHAHPYLRMGCRIIAECADWWGLASTLHELHPGESEDFLASLSLPANLNGSQQHHTMRLCLASFRTDHKHSWFEQAAPNSREAALAMVAEDGAVLQILPSALRWNAETMLAAVKSSPPALEYASPSIQGDKDVVMTAVTAEGCLLRFASPELCQDAEVVSAAITSDPDALEYASPSLRADKFVAMAALAKRGRMLKVVSPELCNDREVVQAAITSDPQALEYASESLRADRDFVLTAVNGNGLALQYASMELRSDREVVLAAIRSSPCALQSASPSLLADREFVISAMEAVAQIGWAWCVCWAFRNLLRPELCNDKEVVLAAIRSNPRALEYVSESLLADRDYVQTMMEQNGRALEYASPELRSSREVVLAAIRSYPQALGWASLSVLADRAFAMAARQAAARKGRTGSAYRHLPKELCKNREVMLAAITSDPQALEYASESLRTDRGFVLTAVNGNGLALQYAPMELRSDREVVLAAIRSNPLHWVSPSLLRSDKEFVVRAMHAHASWNSIVRRDLLHSLAPELRNDREVMLVAIRSDPQALEYASESLRADRDFVLNAVTGNGKALRYASSELRSDSEIVLAAIRSKSCALESSFWEMRRCHAARPKCRNKLLPPIDEESLASIEPCKRGVVFLPPPRDELESEIPSLHDVRLYCLGSLLHGSLSPPRVVESRAVEVPEPRSTERGVGFFAAMRSRASALVSDLSGIVIS